MTDKQAFKVLVDAPFVAGMRSPGKDRPIRLTEDQAKYPLIAGEIARPDTVSNDPTDMALPAVSKTGRRKG